VSQNGPFGIFRGWLVVGAGFAVLFTVYALQFSFGEFRLAATADEGWSQSSLTLIFAVYVFGYSALSIVSGMATDRFGPRLTIGVGSILLIVGYLLWSRAESLAMVALALAVIAPIGMSCSWVPVNATAVRWFVRRRGLAGAVTTAGGSVGNIAGPPMAAALIAAYDWRTAMMIMAGSGLVILLVAASVMVSKPEAVGLYPDGDLHPPNDVEDSGGMTPSEATRTAEFWLMLVLYAVTFTVVFVPFVHGSAFAVGLGLSSLTAAAVISSIGVGGLVGRILVGWLSDRIDRRRAVALALALQVAAFVGFALAQGPAVLYPAAVAFGFGFGGAVAVFPALVADYFGRTHAGALVGRMFGTAGAMAAVGPYVAALIFDATGSYRAAFAISAALNGVALAVALSLPRPRSRRLDDDVVDPGLDQAAV
jgi:MFS family permease